MERPGRPSPERCTNHLAQWVPGFVVSAPAGVVSVLHASVDCSSSGLGFDPKCGFRVAAAALLRHLLVVLRWSSSRGRRDRVAATLSSTCRGDHRRIMPPALPDRARLHLGRILIATPRASCPDPPPFITGVATFRHHLFPDLILRGVASLAGWLRTARVSTSRPPAFGTPVTPRGCLSGEVPATSRSADAEPIRAPLRHAHSLKPARQMSPPSCATAPSINILIAAARPALATKPCHGPLQLYNCTQLAFH